MKNVKKLRKKCNLIRFVIFKAQMKLVNVSFYFRFNKHNKMGTSLFNLTFLSKVRLLFSQISASRPAHLILVDRLRLWLVYWKEGAIIFSLLLLSDI